MNVRLLLVTLALGAAAARGQDDPVAAQLARDKEAFAAAQGKAKEAVLKAFDRHYDAVKANTKLKIADQVAQLEKIEAERKAFDESGAPPSLPGLKAAMGEHRAAVKRAEGQCRLAFERAAKAYRDKGDIKAAAAALEEMKEFLADTAGAVVVVVSGHSGKVLGLQNNGTADGTRVVTADPVKGDPMQQWRVVQLGSGWVHVEHVKTGFLLTAPGRENSTDVVVKKKDGADAQAWKATPVAGQKGLVKLVHKLSGKPLVIDINSKAAGARIILWDDSNQTGGWFALTPVR